MRNILISNTMLYLLLFMCFFIDLSNCQQYYDSSDCTSDTSYPGSRYSCNLSQNYSCKTFLVYRANKNFQTLSNISDLFGMDFDELLPLNNLKSPSDTLNPGREVLLPVSCSCLGQFYQVKLIYKIPEGITISEIACGVFEGLLKSHTLIQENLSQQDNITVGDKLEVPLRCACPYNFTSDSEVEYLVTYPLVEGDGTISLSKKFGISPIDLWAANHLEPHPTVFPDTTILVPLRTYPVLNLNVFDSPPPAPGFLPTALIDKRNRRVRKLYISVAVVAFSLVVLMLVGYGLYVKVLNKRRAEKLRSFRARSSPISCSTARSSPRSGQTTRSSQNSCLSPDLLVGIKYSLHNYSTEEMRKATRNFSEKMKIGEQVYKGVFDNVRVMIKQMRFEDTRQIIDLHSKINHKNIVMLQGACYGDGDTTWSYLVFELPFHGCLRECLSNPTSPLQWHRRTQIAFDIATGLHYLHYSMFLSYPHMNINSRNIFVTESWRAKLANTGSASSASAAGYYEKTDIFEFGIVLLELISGKEDVDGELFKESIGLLGGGASEGGCFGQLRSFVDPCLKEDYPLAEALCLAVLAKACVEDDPLHRPSMDDIIKVIARMI